MTNEKKQYRLNCLLDASYGERLSERSEKSKLPKVAIVAMALDQYLKQADMMEKLQAELTADPVKLAEVCKAFGLTPQE